MHTIISDLYEEMLSYTTSRMQWMGCLPGRLPLAVSLLCRDWMQHRLCGNHLGTAMCMSEAWTFSRA